MTVEILPRYFSRAGLFELEGVAVPADLVDADQVIRPAYFHDVELHDSWSGAWHVETSRVSFSAARLIARQLEQDGYTWRVVDYFTREPVTLPPTTEDP